mmetsp:Transcript_966/g.2028  ORF Transcript_966/g.2028 Transcript_966/m.2028 type:complete len:277 (+) Transcript_966:314-1144(+)
MRRGRAARGSRRRTAPCAPRGSRGTRCLPAAWRALPAHTQRSQTQRAASRAPLELTPQLLGEACARVAPQGPRLLVLAAASSRIVRASQATSAGTTCASCAPPAPTALEATWCVLSLDGAADPAMGRQPLRSSTAARSPAVLAAPRRSATLLCRRSKTPAARCASSHGTRSGQFNSRMARSPRLSWYSSSSYCLRSLVASSSASAACSTSASSIALSCPLRSRRSSNCMALRCSECKLRRSPSRRHPLCCRRGAYGQSPNRSSSPRLLSLPKRCLL